MTLQHLGALHDQCLGSHVRHIRSHQMLRHLFPRRICGVSWSYCIAIRLKTMILNPRFPQRHTALPSSLNERSQRHDRIDARKLPSITQMPGLRE